MLWKCCTQIWKTQLWPQDWKRSVFIPIPKKGNAKECSNYRTIALISHASKVKLKILQARLQYTWTMNFQMFKLDLEKTEEPEIKLPISTGSSKKQESYRKTSTFALLTTPKPLTVWITKNCGKFWKRWEYQTTLSSSWEICMQVHLVMAMVFPVVMYGCESWTIKKAEHGRIDAFELRCWESLGLQGDPASPS